MDNSSQKIHSSLADLLPYFVLFFGVIVSILVWFFLLKEVSINHFLTTLKVSLPWIVLVAGILLALLLAVTVHLIQLHQAQSNELEVVNKHFRNEIADRMKAEETKQKLETALLQGQKLQAVGTLAGGIAHDFNNLLYAIIGYVEMAREDIDKHSIIYKNLGKVLEASQRGQELIARILGFSRRQHHAFKPLPLQETVEGVLSLLIPTIPASVEIIFSPNHLECMILGNQTQLHQIMVNIINNAVDAMDGEGKIEIKLDSVNDAKKVSTLFPNLSNKPYCRILISDTGHGMDQNIQHRIFDPFFTTKEVGKGTGLGLSMVHGIIKEHHGEIAVQSKLGQGTTFTILLPTYIKEKDDGKDFVG